MAQEKQETRAEEVARIRSYLASQATRRTPQQLVEALREAHQQLLTATAAVSDANFRTVPREGEWSTADVLTHVRRIATIEERSICGVLERGEQPANIEDQLEHAPTNATREQLLADIAARRDRLIAVVQQADPQAHLDIVWGHNEFGTMNWREWLLFARVHMLDHARQIQAISAVLAQQP
ncbi:MAG TPA: DinB family protein [Ktedonobacteraceae bacterium]|nr:DinB family protein [Ktedonobacteraceae bacterium]